MGESGQAADTPAAGGGENTNEAKAQCSTPASLQKLGITLSPGLAYKTRPIKLSKLTGKYIQKAELAFEIELKTEAAFTPLAGVEPEKETTGSLWQKAAAILIKKRNDIFDTSQWKFGNPVVQGPEAGGGLERSGGETGASFDARVVGIEVDSGPLGKLSVEFDLLSFSDKKWSGPKFTGKLAQSVEAECKTDGGWFCANVAFEVSAALDIVPSYGAIWDAVKGQAKQLWKTVAEGAEAYVTADGIIASCLLGGVVLTLAITYVEIEQDDLVRATTDNVEKWIEQAQQDYLNGLTTPLGSSNGSGPYYQQGHTDRATIFQKWDAWMTDQQNQAGVPAASQVHAYIMDSTGIVPAGASENPDAVTWFNNYINANAREIKGNALANVATQVIQSAWASWVKANPAPTTTLAKAFKMYSDSHTVFTNLACSKPVEWTTYYKNIDFPAPFDTKTYMDNPTYLAAYPDDSSAKSS